MDQSLKTIEKLKLINNLFMELPESLIKKLPIPSPFRRLPLTEQRKAHRIFYNKKLNFNEKMRRLENFLDKLTEEEIELIPIRSIPEKNSFGNIEGHKNGFTMPRLVEFEVPVLLQFNGHLEYKELLPQHIFAQFSSIYMDQSLKTIEKLKLINNLFMELPESLIKKLPIPSPFRRLPLTEQRKAHRIFYNKKLNFNEKMRRLENFLDKLTEEEIELIPIRSIPEKNSFGNIEGHKNGFTMPRLVEFEVPVLLQFNGHLEANSLQQYLSRTEFKLLKTILIKHGISENSRARLVGILLKQAYQSNPDNFPLPLNGDSREITDEIRHLGVRLMFGKNPYDRVDPFIEKFEMLRYNTTSVDNLTRYQKRQKQKENQQKQNFIENEHCQESGRWHIPLAELQQNQEGQLIFVPNKLFIEKIDFFP
ncbi:hypothetical protein ACQ4LE_001204 [Meloidogyne hapla]